MKANGSYSYGFRQSLYHVVLVPYRRKRVFMRADIRALAMDCFYHIANAHRFTIHELEVVEDHVHLFIGIRPSQSIAQVMQYLKGVSSKELRKVFPELKAYHRRRLWSRGKYFRPISDVSSETITHYIKYSQSKHHKKLVQSKWQKNKQVAERAPQQSTLDSFAS